jgi:uncharacterized protein YrzB (UPF0473 family)
MEGEAEIEIITLTDEDGSESDYGVLAVLTLDEQEFAILAPIEQLDADEADLDLYAFHYKETGDEDVELDAVEDEELLERVFALFDEIMGGGEDEA